MSKRSGKLALADAPANSRIPSRVVSDIDNVRIVGGVVTSRWARPRFRSRTSEAMTPTNDTSGPESASMNLIKSKKRVADHGEVFTPAWLVEKMLDLVKGEIGRIESRFLEPACGSGNFLVPILQRKLAAVELRYGKSPFDKQRYALLGLMCCYGVELLSDNVEECRGSMLAVISEYLGLSEGDELYRAACHVLSQNIIHGDAMTMKSADGSPIVVAEWADLGKGKFSRRDFRLDVLTGRSSFSAEGSLFANLGKHEVFVPVETHPTATVGQLAQAFDKAADQ